MHILQTQTVDYHINIFVKSSFSVIIIPMGRPFYVLSKKILTSDHSNE